MEGLCEDPHDWELEEMNFAREIRL
jgi:hypothetical protein